MTEEQPPFPHVVDADIFREALAYSEADTGFMAGLIEKDYYCSLVLRHLFAGDSPLVFKGGTCLAKVYADFYRLSEDLDLIIPVDVTASKSKRSASMGPVRALLDELPEAIPRLGVSAGFEGHNQSSQYIAYLEYRSEVAEKDEAIKIEVGLREPLLCPGETRTARTIAFNPFSGSALLPAFDVHVMSRGEAYAEKTRAALTRREPAIRDFYDLLYAFHELGLDPVDGDFIRMVKAKLAIPGNPQVDLSDERRRDLDRQTQSRLRPVLRPADFEKFSLDQAFDIVLSIAEAVRLSGT